MSTTKPWKPAVGGVYACLKSNKELGYKRGRNYLFHPDGSLREYTKRRVNLLLNGYNCLRQPGAFQPCAICPYCGDELFDLATVVELPGWASPFQMHAATACARKWDADAKGYCVDCNADLQHGLCPKCYEP